MRAIPLAVWLFYLPPQTDRAFPLAATSAQRKTRNTVRVCSQLISITCTCSPNSSQVLRCTLCDDESTKRRNRQSDEGVILYPIGRIRRVLEIVAVDNPHSGVEITILIICYSFPFCAGWGAVSGLTGASITPSRMAVRNLLSLSHPAAARTSRNRVRRLALRSVRPSFVSGHAGLYFCPFDIIPSNLAGMQTRSNDSTTTLRTPDPALGITGLPHLARIYHDE